MPTTPIATSGGQRRTHLARVLGEIQRRGSASRTEIANGAGLSRTTVSGIVSELLAVGRLTEDPDRRPGTDGGRPTTLLTLRADAGSLVGVHFAHDGVLVALADLRGRETDSRHTSLDMDHHPSQALEFAADSVSDLLRTGDQGREQPLGVGVAISGPTRDGRPVTTGGLLPDWAGIDVATRLERGTGLPVVVGNDANLGALAEWTFGAAHDRTHFAYVMLADGVGAGIVLDGKLYEGRSGTAGELGHVLVEPGGSICRCGGRGCLETVAGGPALVRAVAPTRGATKVSDVLRLAADGDVGAQRVIADAGRGVGQALGGVCAVLDIDLVVVGGYGPVAGESLLSAIRVALQHATPPAISRDVKVIAGALGARAELAGAIAMAGRAMAVPTLLPD